MSRPKAKAKPVIVTSRKNIKARRHLIQEIGVQRSAAVRAAQERAEAAVPLDAPTWTDDKVLKLVAEVVRTSSARRADRV